MENKSKSRLVGMIGFAMRAGKVIIGTDSVCSAMAKRGKARPNIVLISNSASDSTKKKISTKAEFYSIECIVLEMDGDELGRLLGKLYSPAAVAIVDERFAEEIRRAVREEK